MHLTLIQLFLAFFMVFAFTRVILRFKEGNFTTRELVFWILIFGSALVFVINPALTTDIAHAIGIGRGVDVVVYISIAVLFYLVFRLFIYMQNIKHDITEIVRKIALDDWEKVKNSRLRSRKK